MEPLGVIESPLEGKGTSNFISGSFLLFRYSRDWSRGGALHVSQPGFGALCLNTHRTGFPRRRLHCGFIIHNNFALAPQIGRKQAPAIKVADSEKPILTKERTTVSLAAGLSCTAQ
eukprot:1873857-Prymnesium_polylepis.1